MTLNSLANKSARYLVRKETITEDKFEIYAFGMEMLFSTILNGILVLIASLVLGVFFETVLMLIPFMIIRSKAGGFHAKTHWGCMFGFLAVYISSVLAVQNFAFLRDSVILFILISVSAAAILIIGAVKHKNREVEADELAKFRRLARRYAALLAVVGWAGAYFFPQFFAYYTQGFFIAAFSLTAARAASKMGELRP